MFGMWKQINFANGPEERADHGMCVSDDGNRIFVFGGQTPRKAFNDLWQFTISTSTWELLPSPSSPAPRWGSTLSYVNEKLFLFGGDDVRQSDYYNLCIYHLQEKRWELVVNQTGIAPQPRLHHTATVIPIPSGKGILVYAGRALNAQQEFADVKILNVQTLEWYNPFTLKHGRDPDEMPPQRKRHSAVLYKNSLLVFAGWQENRYTGSNWADYYVLDLDNWVWKNPNTRGTPPEARAGHTAVVFNDKMFIWGGWGAAPKGSYGELHYIELDDNNWNRFRRGKPPPERFNFGSVLIGSKLYVFGGNLDPQTEQCTKELWVADLSSVY